MQCAHTASAQIAPAVERMRQGAKGWEGVKAPSAPKTTARSCKQACSTALRHGSAAVGVFGTMRHQHTQAESPWRLIDLGE